MYVYHLDILANDIYNLIDEKTAMYKGFNGMKPYLAELEYIRHLIERRSGNMTALFLLINAIEDKERKYTREISRTDPETGRKLRTLQDEAYQRRRGIRFINSTLIKVYHPVHRWRIEKDTPFIKMLAGCYSGTLTDCYYRLCNYTPSSDEKALTSLAFLDMRYCKAEPSESEYIMLEECQDGDHAYVQDRATGTRYEIDSMPLEKLLGCLIPYKIDSKDDYHTYVALVLRELSRKGFDGRSHKEIVWLKTEY